MTCISSAILNDVIVPRPADSHKGDFGRVLLIGGSEQYGGAIIMATEAAVNAGAGLTCTVTHSINLTALHARVPEAMFLDLRDRQLAQMISQVDVVVCGPGLGMNQLAKQVLLMVKEQVTVAQTLVLDASALDLIARDPKLLPTNAGKIILTPHQMEWQRLSQLRIPFQTNAANIVALKTLFPAGNGILVLKSHRTKVMTCQGKVFENPVGNAGMATGGMGDILTGILGAFIGQFGASLKTILAAVYLHSLAGDQLAKESYVVRPTTLVASLPHLMKQFCQSPN